MQNLRTRPHRRLFVESLEDRRVLSATSLTALTPEPDTLARNDAWVASETDVTAPRVVSVRVSSQAWQSSYLDRVDPALRAGFPMSSLASQHASLPWTNVDQIQIQFSEDVEASFDPSVVKVHGARILDYQSLFSVAYDRDSHVATIQFAESLSADRLVIGIHDSLSDAAGNQLDGEWLDGGTHTTSGDGTAGGNFYYRINVLAGDLSGDGVVLGNDVTGGLLSRGKSVSDDEFNPLSDLDGSGNTIPEEIEMLVRLRGTWLPTGEPQLSSFPIVPQGPLDIAQSDDHIIMDAHSTSDEPQVSHESLIKASHEPLISAEPLIGDEPLVDGFTTSMLEMRPTACHGLERVSQPTLDSASTLLLPPGDLLIYGPLLPDEYRLRFLTFKINPSH